MTDVWNRSHYCPLWSNPPFIIAGIPGFQDKGCHRAPKHQRPILSRLKGKKQDTDFVKFQICVWSPTKNGIGHDDNIRHLQSLQWKAPQLTAVSCCNYSKGAGRQELVDFILSGYQGWRVTHHKHIQTPFKKHPIIKFQPMIASGSQLFNRNSDGTRLPLLPKIGWHHDECGAWRQ